MQNLEDSLKIEYAGIVVTGSNIKEQVFAQEDRIMFSSTFFDTNSDIILEEVRNKGVYACEAAIKAPFTDRLLAKINFKKVLLNENDTGVVTLNDHKFLSHCLATSEEVYKIITSDKVLEICDKYFKKKYRLINHRVYQTNKKQHLPWHSDNNKHSGTEYNGKHSMPGLLFMFYLTDVSKNAFQFIEGSHKVSKNYVNQRFLSTSYVEENYGKDVRTFKLSKGSFIVCDTHGLHRAEPFNDERYSRTTLLFQVDEVGDDIEPHGENNLINAAYLKNLSPKLMQYLGFGYDKSYPAFPNSSLGTLPFSTLISIQKRVISGLFAVGLKSAITRMLPGERLINARRLFWKLKSKISR
jgi:hypothetical protein